MYSSRLAHQFRLGLVQTNLEIGLLCLVSQTKSAGPTSSSQVQRFIRSSESILSKNREKAASVIWKQYKRYKIRHMHKIKQSNILEKLKNSNASKIQIAFRGFQLRKAQKLLKISESLSKIREMAATFIQTAYKLFKVRQKVKISIMSCSIYSIRNISAIFIQKVFKGSRTRKDLFFIREKFPSLITWRGADEVSMIGSFTYPPWKVEIPLVYSKILNLSYSLFFAENKLPLGRYLLKFKSGNTIILSLDLPSFKNSSGEVFNVVHLKDLKDKKKVSRPVSLKSFKSSKETSSKKIKLAETLINSTRLKISKNPEFNSLIEENSNSHLKVSFSASLSCKPTHRRMQPSPIGANSSLFIDKTRKCFGISSFDEDWPDFPGPDPENFSFEILEKFQTELVKSNSSLPPLSHLTSHLEILLTSAYNKVVSYGSCAVLFAMLADSQLFTLSLGSSQLLVLRPKTKLEYQVVFKSRRSEIGFNYFELLGKTSDKHEKCRMNRFLHPVRTRAERVEVMNGDLIVAGNSGIFDNLFDEELANVVSTVGFKDLPQSLIKGAWKRAWDTQAKTPFYYSAKNYGIKALGGRLNDFAVVVGRVRL